MTMPRLARPLLLLLLPLLTSAAAADFTLGINSNTLRPEEVAHLRALGIRRVRLTGILQRWETNDRGFRAAMREMAAAADAAGIEVLWVLHNVPEGAAVPARLEDRARWMERMTRFAEWVATLPATGAVQLWNEPDQWVQAPFGAAQDLPFEARGRLYAEQLRIAYPRIKAVNPAVRVVAAATADYPPRQGYADFLRGMLVGDPPVDAVAVHAYGPWPRARRIVAEARAIAGDRPLWVTEFGNDQPNGARFDPRHHLQSIVSQVEGYERDGLAARAYLYTLPTDPRPQYSQHGLLEPDGTPRAAYRWLRDRRR